MPRAISVIIIGLTIVFISFFTLLAIFDSLGKLSERCKIENLEFCNRISENKIYVIIIVLIVAGLAFILMFVSYMLIYLRHSK